MAEPNVMEVDGKNEVAKDIAKDVKKRKKKKTRCNYSYRVHISSHERSLHRSKNASSNSSNLHRSSLRANNRALACALQQMKEEYRCLHQKYVDGVTEKQALMMHVSEVQGFAELKKEDVARELEKLHADKSLRLREVLNHVTNNLMGTVQLLSDAIEMCEPSPENSKRMRTANRSSETKGRTVNKPRFTDLNTQATTEAICESNCIGPAGDNRHQSLYETSEPVDEGVKRTAFDMTVIMEQSYLAADEEEKDTTSDHSEIIGEDFKSALTTISQQDTQVEKCQDVSSSLQSIICRSDPFVDSIPLAVLNLSPHKNRRTSCFKKKDVPLNDAKINKRVSFEDTSRTITQPKELEENKENSNTFKDSILTSPRRSKRTSSKTVDISHIPQEQVNKKISKPVLQAVIQEKDFSNRRETFVVTASKQTLPWPSPSSAEKAFGGNKADKLALCNKTNDRNNKTEDILLKKLQVSEDIVRLVPVENSSCFPVTEKLSEINTVPKAIPSLLAEPCFLSEMGRTEDDCEDETCLMIHTMELTESLQTEIEHNMPAEAFSQPCHDSSSVLSVKPPESIKADAHHELQTSENFQLADAHYQGAALTVEISLGDGDTQEKIRCTKSQALKTNNQIKSRTEELTGCMLPRPSFSFFNTKKIKMNVANNPKKTNTPAIVDSARSEPILQPDIFSWCGVSPSPSKRHENNSADNEPDQNNLSNDGEAELCRTLVEYCSSSDGIRPNAIELVPSSMLPLQILHSPNTSLDVDISSPLAGMESLKTTPSILFSDSSDGDEDDETWIPYSKTMRNKSKGSKTANKKKANFPIDCDPEGLKKDRKSTAASKLRNSRVGTFVTNGSTNDRHMVKRGRGRSTNNSDVDTLNCEENDKLQTCKETPVAYAVRLRSTSDPVSCTEDNDCTNKHEAGSNSSTNQKPEEAISDSALDLYSSVRTSFEGTSKQHDGFSTTSKSARKQCGKSMRKRTQSYKRIKRQSSSSEEQPSDTDKDSEKFDKIQMKALIPSELQHTHEEKTHERKERDVGDSTTLDHLRPTVSGELTRKPCRKTISRESGLAEKDVKENESGNLPVYVNEDPEEEDQLSTSLEKSTTALNLEKVREQLTVCARQIKRTARSSPVMDKRKWKTSASNSDDDDENNLRPRSKTTIGTPEGRLKPRRATTQVSYKEPSIGRKLRQGDPHTDNMFLGSKKPRSKKKTK